MCFSLEKKSVLTACQFVCICFPFSWSTQPSALHFCHWERAVRDVVLGEQQRLLLEPGLAQVYLRTFPVGVWLACLSVTVPACVGVWRGQIAIAEPESLSLHRCISIAFSPCLPSGLQGLAQMSPLFYDFLRSQRTHGTRSFGLERQYCTVVSCTGTA